MTVKEKRKRIYKALYKAANKGNRGCLTGQAIGILATQANILSRVSFKTVHRLEMAARYGY